MPLSLRKDGCTIARYALLNARTAALDQDKQQNNSYYACYYPNGGHAIHKQCSFHELYEAIRGY